MKFWLDKGVAAFRVDAVPFFMEDPLLREDEHLDQLARVTCGTKEGFSYRLNHPDTLIFLHDLYSYVQQYDRENRKQRQTYGDIIFF